MQLRQPVDPLLMRGRGRKLAIATTGLVLFAGLLYGLAELAMQLHYYPGPPTVEYPTPADRREARVQDLDYFRRFLTLDRSYTGVTRAVASELIAELESRLDSVSDAGFQLAIAQAVAVADNGHTNVWLGRFSRAHGRLPLRLYWFADGVHVLRVRADHADLLGAELLSVGGVPVVEAGVALKTFVGGPWEGYRAYRGPILLELPAAHFAVGLSDSESASTLTFRKRDGSLVVRRIEAESLAEEEPLFWPNTYLLSAPPEPESRTWLGLASRVPELPLYLQEPQLEFRMADLPQGGLYVQYRANVGEGIAAFGQSVLRRIMEQTPAYLVLDQRLNGGGDYTTTAGLMSALPGLLGDAVPIYVITGPATFSAGINSVAFVRAAGMPAAGASPVTLIGERVGDRERMVGETNEFELPNSRLGMTFNTGLHDVANGCPPFPECYFRNYFYDVAVGKLDPDMTVETLFTDYLVGLDPVLEAIQLLRGIE